MVVSVLEAGTVTIKNKQTGNSVYLLPDNNGQSLHTKPDDDTDDFKVRTLFVRYSFDIQRRLLCNILLLLVEYCQARQWQLYHEEPRG